MFKVHKAQLEAFRPYMQDSFEERAVQSLRESVPTQTAVFSDQEIRQRVRKSIVRAREHGLTTESQIVALAEVSYLLGEWFEPGPMLDWATTVLRDSRLVPDEKAALVRWAAWNVYRERHARKG